ncbi:ATP-binding protein [Roseibium aggregatum]|uniref:histidine kinase n=1 Tax=Roseibium aggregatum TaxID=187304 RepID=A0A939EAU5_9HYPH|nr:ATP-binding protein [Roseibium aggregatum]MBN9669770.1 PAS domain S-box protein [Roseibium aggregatum]
MLLTAFCVALSTLTIGSLSFMRIRTETLDLAEAKLAAEARLLSQRFTLGYRLIARDLKTVSKSPPIQGLIRALENGGIDPLDGSTDMLWRARLATIFGAALQDRPEYFQFRYIGIADLGRELVRVDRSPGGFMSTDPKNLQQKALEPYFTQAREAGTGEVVFSEVTYNREYGLRDKSQTPTLRGMLPIDGPDGTRFGFLIINVNYEQMLQTAFAEIDPGLHTFVVNGSGDYMEHDVAQDRQAPYRLQLHSDPVRQTPEIVKSAFRFEATEGLLYTADDVGYYIRDMEEFQEASANLGVIVQVPKNDWYAAAVKTRNEVLTIGALIILFSTGLAVVVARTMMQPLADLARTVRETDAGDSLDSLPAGRNDEIGDLAEAIQSRTRELIEIRNAELSESRAHASAIVNNVIDGLILIDSDGTIEQFNPSCERMFGYKAKDIIGRNVKVLMKPEDARHHDMFLSRFQAGQGGKSIDLIRELEAVNRSGRVFPIELGTSTVTVDGKAKFSGVIRDISERQEIDRLRREFVSTVSHELRTPLTSIRGSLTLIDSLATNKLPPKVDKLLIMAQKNTERLILLVNDILDFEKLRADKVHFNMQQQSLEREVRKAIDLNQGFAEISGIALKADFTPEPVEALLDTDKFQQILSNLISNAVKFSQSDGTVTVRTRTVGELARIEVEDRGTGIPEDFRDRIFEPFSQADGSSSRSRSGTGLGLNITKGYVEGMGGEIGFESETGTGTTFWIQFPKLKETGVSLGQPKPGYTQGRLLGLHLEDDPDFYVVLASGMDGELDMLHARTVAEARELLGKYTFDIVILDRILKDGEGLDVIEDIPDPENTKIVVVTSVDENVQHIHVDETIVKAKTPPGRFVERFAFHVDDLKEKKMKKAGAA